MAKKDRKKKSLKKGIGAAGISLALAGALLAGLSGKISIGLSGSDPEQTGQQPSLSLETTDSSVKTASSDDSVDKTGFYLDTVINIKIYGTDDSTILDDCFSMISDYENMLSRTIEGSDIWKINHSSGQPTAVSEETASLIELALQYSELSDGAFDITIAPVVSLWDFHEDGDHSLPDDAVLAEALSHVDYHTVQVDGIDTPVTDENGNPLYTVTLSDPEAAIDLGGIAKGFIADKAKEFLLSRGITSGLINLGGNVLAIGEKPNADAFKIGIRRPFGSSSMDLITVVPVRDLSVVTSGTYERYFEIDGVLYHHILDPSTGYPAITTLQSVSILSESSAQGDALSTTCFLLGLEKGMELIESLDGIEAMFITDDQVMHKSSGFPEG
jgi:thiamine biosynthesis lipoprotein